MAEEIQVSEETRQRLASAISEKSGEEVGNVAAGDYQKLRAAALSFINGVKHFGENAKISESDIMNFTKGDYAKAKQILVKNIAEKEMIGLYTKFQEALDNFLDRELFLAIVLDNGEILFFDSVQEKAIYENSSKNKKRLNLNRGGIDPSAVFSEIENQLFLNSEEQEHSKKVQNIYKLSVERFDETMSEGEAYGKKWPYIYWHEDGGKREYGFVSNKGILGEAYILALFERIENTKLVYSTDDANLRPFYYDYILSADNRSGAIIGDISNDILDKVQISVKAMAANRNTGASSQSFPILVSIAQDIIESASNMTPQELATSLREKELDPKAREFTNNYLIKNLEKKINNTLRETISSSENVQIEFALN